MPERLYATWGELLQEAVEKPGRMGECSKPTPPFTITVFRIWPSFAQVSKSESTHLRDIKLGTVSQVVL
jgi:hypothetical protein